MLRQGLTLVPRRRAAGAIAAVLAAGSLPGLGLSPTPAWAIGPHKKVCCETAAVAPATRSYVVRTYQVVDDDDAPADDGSRDIVVQRTTPPPSEVGRSRALGSEQRSRGVDPAGGAALPLLLKTARDADGNRVPQLGGSEPATRSRSIDDQPTQPRVVVRSAAASTSGTTRTVVKRYVTVPATSRAVMTRAIPADEPTVVLRSTSSPVVVRAIDAPVVVVKKCCH